MELTDQEFAEQKAALKKLREEIEPDFKDAFKSFNLDVRVETALRTILVELLARQTFGAEQRRSLAKRVEAIEQNHVRFLGPWKSETSYGKGALVQREGGLWLAERPSHLRPGDADSGWRLVVKKGSFDR